jgi:hypothetical protein
MNKLSFVLLLFLLLFAAGALYLRICCSLENSDNQSHEEKVHAEFPIIRGKHPFGKHSDETCCEHDLMPLSPDETVNIIICRD